MRGASGRPGPRASPGGGPEDRDPLADVEEGYRRVQAASWPGIVDPGYLTISKDAADRDPQRVADMLAGLPRAASPASFIG